MIVIIDENDNREYHGTGNVIGEHWILTVAHNFDRELILK